MQFFIAIFDHVKFDNEKMGDQFSRQPPEITHKNHTQQWPVKNSVAACNVCMQDSAVVKKSVLPFSCCRPTRQNTVRCVNQKNWITNCHPEDSWLGPRTGPALQQQKKKNAVRVVEWCHPDAMGHVPSCFQESVWSEDVNWKKEKIYVKTWCLRQFYCFICVSQTGTKLVFFQWLDHWWESNLIKIRKPVVGRTGLCRNRLKDGRLKDGLK